MTSRRHGRVYGIRQKQVADWRIGSCITAFVHRNSCSGAWARRSKANTLFEVDLVIRGRPFVGVHLHVIIGAVVLKLPVALLGPVCTHPGAGLPGVVRRRRLCLLGTPRARGLAAAPALDPMKLM